MTPFPNIKAHQDLIDNYDRVDHNYWNSSSKPILDLKEKIREHLVKEQNYLCAYCNYSIRSTNGNNWDIDHIIPKSKNPNFLFEPHNLILSCKDCNQIKSDKDTYYNSGIKALKNYPMDAKKIIIIHPFLDKEEYDHHIKKIALPDSSFHIFYGKTSKGKKTIEICNLLRFTQLFSGWDDVEVKRKESLDEPNEVLKKELEELKKGLEELKNSHSKIE